MNQFKKYLILSIAALIVVAAAVCFLPRVEFVETRMTGTLLYKERVAEEPVYVTVQGYILDYLFRPDQVDFRFLQSGIDNWIFTEYTDPVSRKDQMFAAPYIISSCAYYKASEDLMTTAYYAFSPEEEMLLIYIMDDLQPVIACSANGEKTLEEITEYFDVFVDVFSTFYEE